MTYNCRTRSKLESKRNWNERRKRLQRQRRPTNLLQKLAEEQMERPLSWVLMQKSKLQVQRLLMQTMCSEDPCT